MPYKLAIFDFDGTLADSMPWFREVINTVAARFDFKTVDDAEVEVLRRCDAREIMRRLGVPMWKLPMIGRHMKALMARDIDRIALFPGVDAMLRDLAERGVAMALVSSNSVENVRRVLGSENAALIGCYECGAAVFGKRAKFRKVLRRCGVRADEAIYIGDELRDLEAARGAGIAFGGVTWGYATPDALAARGPTLLFHSFADVARQIA
ncbi:HAD hydrolase-like protein [Azospirillum sp. ST 5-10]|uniref:HAD hydrolase-like protein n=1 Tax=unclassified Azospirillum TaxID=2630922 RepID=UPI003F49F401